MAYDGGFCLQLLCGVVRSSNLSAALAFIQTARIRAARTRTARIRTLITHNLFIRTLCIIRTLRNTIGVVEPRLVSASDGLS